MSDFDLTPPVAAQHPAMTRGRSGGVGCSTADLAAAPLPVSSPTLRILLVNDDAALLGMYCRIVARWPIPTTVRCAIDAIIALKEVERAMPDLVVCDVAGAARQPGIRPPPRAAAAAADTAIVLVSAFEPGALERLGGVPPRVRVYEAVVPFAALRDFGAQLLAAKAPLQSSSLADRQRTETDVDLV